MNFLYETNFSLYRWDLVNRVMYSTIGICFPFVRRNGNKWTKCSKPTRSSIESIPESEKME